MDADFALIERATDLIKCCKLPRLTRSIDEAQLQPVTFQDFLTGLAGTLPKVFDSIAAHETQLLGYDEFNQDNVDFQVHLVLVLAEQLAIPGELYDFQTQSEACRRHVNKLIERGMLERLLNGRDVGSERVLKRLWEHYRKVLPAKEWMYHVGDVLSFVRICELLYGGFMENPPTLDQAVASFVLAVGIALVEYHDPEYELQGLRLFNVLLGDQHRALLKETNIHEVVFQNAFRLNAKAKGEAFLRQLWRCHLKFIELTESEKTDFSEWSKFDDVVESLLENMAFENNLDHSSVLLLYLLKLLTLDLRNFVIDDLDDVQALDTKCHLYEPVLEQLRKLCALEFHNRRFYRWSRRLLSMLPFELEKACGSSRIHGKYMHGVNLLFVLVVFPVEPEATPCSSEAQTTLLDFMIAFKRHLREQYGRIQSLTGKCDFLHSLKASVSCDKSIAVFSRNVAPRYFKENLEALRSAGMDAEEGYQEDRIFYECLKELQLTNNLGF